MKNYIPVMCLLFALVSCKQSPNSGSDLLTTRLIHKDSMLGFDYANLIDQNSIDTIIFETNKECMFGQIDKIIIDNDDIFILDKENRNNLLVFDREGRFKNEVGDIGKGPGEYLDINDFDVDTILKRVYVHSTMPGKLITYSYRGDFVEQCKLESYFGLEFKKLRSGNFVFYLNTPRIDIGTKEVLINHQILIVSPGGKLIKSMIEFNPKNFPLMPSRSFFSSQIDGVYFILPWDNRIMCIDGNDSLHVKLSLNMHENFAIHEVPSGVEVSLPALFSLKKPMNFCNFRMNSENLFTVNNSIGKKGYTIWGKCLSGQIIYGGFNNSSGQEIYSIIGTFGNYFISETHPSTLEKVWAKKEVLLNANPAIHLFTFKKQFNELSIIP